MQKYEPALATYAASRKYFDIPVDPRVYGAYRTVSTKLTYETGLFIHQIKDGDTNDKFMKLFAEHNIGFKKIYSSKHATTNRIIDFNSKQDAEKAQELLKQRDYKVSWKRAPPEDKYNLFIEGLPPKVTNDDLKKFVMDTCPQIPPSSIQSVHVEESKGFGFVRFSDVEKADEAERLLNESTFPSHPDTKLNVKKANNKNNSNFNGPNRRYNQPTLPIAQAQTVPFRNQNFSAFNQQLPAFIQPYMHAPIAQFENATFTPFNRQSTFYPNQMHGAVPVTHCAQIAPNYQSCYQPSLQYSANQLIPHTFVTNGSSLGAAQVPQTSTINLNPFLSQRIFSTMHNNLYETDLAQNMENLKLNASYTALQTPAMNH
ncbi:hypothetical protein Ciccas_007378 [Cichlidogyrus casuarinus]|uniref:RRM domain-containing protein n=1 Tax=Cichlidogyrus casuarinus TaxID=1844966 RepID=A0ABD2Q3P6_9PLAT